MVCGRGFQYYEILRGKKELPKNISEVIEDLELKDFPLIGASFT